jgi:hypothetical protein
MGTAKFLRTSKEAYLLIIAVFIKRAVSTSVTYKLYRIILTVYHFVAVFHIKLSYQGLNVLGPIGYVRSSLYNTDLILVR